MTSFLYPVTQPIKLYTGLDGKPLDGGFIYFGTANQNPETNPVQMYWDSAGTILAAQPLRTIGGYISRQGSPANIYATGDFSITVRASDGTLVFTSPTSTDLQLALSIAGSTIAASIPIADAGNYYTTDNVESALQQIGNTSTGFISLSRLAAAVQNLLVPTGAMMDYSGKTSLPNAGWVWASGRTIGNASSGATERANIDTLALYTLLWNDWANTELPIQDSAGSATTRGVSASNDFAANKRLPVPDCRGRVRAGKDDMGGSVAARLTATTVDGTVMGNAGGTETHALSEAELAAHVHSGAVHTHDFSHTHTGPSHTHDISHTHGYGSPSGSFPNGSGGSNCWASNLSNTSTTGAASTSTSGAGGTGNTGAASTSTTGNPTAANTGSDGSGTAHTSVQPTIIFTAIIKL